MIDPRTVEKNYKKWYTDGVVQYTKRLLTGLCHYVYYVEDNRGRQLIFRYADKEQVHLLNGSVYWLRHMKAINVPTPIIIHSELSTTTPYIILEYLPGRDLGYVYNDMTKDEKQSLAREMIRIQHCLEERIIPTYNNHYGYLTSLEDSHYEISWYRVVLNHLKRSQKRIIENGVFLPRTINIAFQRLEQLKAYFLSLPPTPFFDDATTKNVLIQDGKLTGIIDHDQMCFGDPLYQIALTHMSLLNNYEDTDYTDYWISCLNLTDVQKEVFDFYVLCFCLDFMSEAGMRFNREEPLKLPEEDKQKLLYIYQTYADKMSQ